MRLLNWIRRLDFGLSSGGLYRFAILLVATLLIAVTITDFSSVPSVELAPGDVAPNTVEAPFTFEYSDQVKVEQTIERARQEVVPVYRYDVALYRQLLNDLEEVFSKYQLLKTTEGKFTPEIGAAFRQDLGLPLADSHVMALYDASFPEQALGLIRSVVSSAMQLHIIYGPSDLPPDRGIVRVIELQQDEARIYDVNSGDQFVVLGEARSRARIQLLEARVDAPWQSAAAEVIELAIRPNVQIDLVETNAKRESAAKAAADSMPTMLVKKGTTLFRQGDVLSETNIAQYEVMRSSSPDRDKLLNIVAITFFVLLLLSSLYHFGVTTLKGFSNRLIDVGAVATLLVLVAVMSRFVTEVSPGMASLVGMGATPSSIWFVVPVAGAAMVVRLLVGISWSVLFAIVASGIVGLLMQLDALIVLYYLISSIAAAGAITHTRERLAVVKVGFFIGLVNAAVVLMIHFVRLYLGDVEVGVVGDQNPLWAMMFAFASGGISVFLVLGLLPLFELVGFVTDYRLMELATLDHRLLRQLVERAPGSYHHSVMVGSLAEAGCEAIGANALQARVASYFHDIGKSMRPDYFIENQRDGHNRHDTMTPEASAKVIISHVTDGLALAKEYGLPKPITDNIAMHHGTGLLQYFYAKACQAADPGEVVDEAQYRYPGPKPDSREAGIVMLADKVEAATRTLKSPSEDAFRQMIGEIISSVMADGQFSSCPITFKEIHTVAEVFVVVLMGIYHQRIEYPSASEFSKLTADAKKAVTITLDPPITDVPAPPREVLPGESDDGGSAPDYESVKHLPHS